MEKDKDQLQKRNRQMMGGSAYKIIAKHTVESGQTLSDVALKYYNHATPPYWKLLLEVNKAILKGDEKNIKKGLVLEIPELPEDLKQ